MASTYSNLKIELIGTGEQAGIWGTTTNTNLGTAIEEAIVGSADVPFSSADVTLTLTNTNTTQSARHLRLNLTGTSGGARNLILGSGCQIDKPYLINNGLADTVTVKNTTGNGIAVPAGKTMWVYNNGTDVVDAVTHLSSLTLSTALPVASGGTGQTTFTDGQLLIGNTTGNTLAKATLTAGTGVTITNGNGSITIAATGSGGTVTSVAVSGGTTGLTTSGGPITSSGTITLAGTLAVANGGTGVTSSTGTGSTVLSASPTFTGTVTTAAISMADNLLNRPNLQDYSIEGSAIGNTGSTRTLDLTVANFFSATLDQACTFTFSNPPGSGDFGTFVLELTNGGAFAITWPAAVDWPGGVAPTLTASGKDQLVFTTRDAGTTWFGFVAGLDIK